MTLLSDGTHKNKLLVVTFIGSHRMGFYRDCRQMAERLEKSLSGFNVEFVQYDLKSILKEVGILNGKFLYLLTRYGAGAWFWKPIVIKKALRELEPEFLIYLDSDCVIIKDPISYVQEALRGFSVAVFRQQKALASHISERAARRLRLSKSELQDSYLLTAGVIIVRNDLPAREFLNTWDDALSDPSLLLSPICSDKSTMHLHDQSVLSGLYAKKMISCNLIHSGFYSQGTESLSDSLENSWLYTGTLDSQDTKFSLRTRLMLVADYQSRSIYDFFKSLLITPIHSLVFRIHLYFSDK